jgi:hypothetical protein
MALAASNGIPGLQGILGALDQCLGVVGRWQNDSISLEVQGWWCELRNTEDELTACCYFYTADYTH